VAYAATWCAARVKIWLTWQRPLDICNQNYLLWIGRPLKPYHRTKEFVNNCCTSKSVTIFEMFGVYVFFHIGAMVKINSTSGFRDISIPDFDPNNMWSEPLRHYHGSKFDDDRWKIATCRAFNSFCVTDEHTHSLTHTQTNWFHNMSNAANALFR